ncbi:MAG: 30S ribosomal protein S4 [Pirellulaceae bacterium]|jgi:small subunit ribosomal protein S4|nr:30S ribosomal protein S4 [Pirellulaceae bacterium]MDP7020411.1 30S ribosomal protein S4 [Pirellulaceae bacterium]
MARYNGPKARINRRLGTQIYESAGAIRAADRREAPPGMHTRGRRPSNYGLALMEKQKVKHYYGLGERQLRRYFTKVSRKTGNTGEMLLIMCEGRLDNVIRRAGYTRTRPQARQGIAHGHFQVNGVKVTSPSFQVRPGDVITVRNRTNLLTYYRDLAAQNSGEPVDWISFDAETLRATVQGLPGPEDVSVPLNDVNVVVEFLSR